MAYPDRTYGTVTLPGAKEATNYLVTPVDGGYYGDGVVARGTVIAGFAATEASGVGEVETTSEGS